MQFTSIIWDEEDDPDGNVQHIAQHDLTPEDVDHVLRAPASRGVSRNSGSPIVWGYTPERRYIVVVYKEVAEGMVRVITAYEVPEP